MRKSHQKTQAPKNKEGKIKSLYHKLISLLNKRFSEPVSHVIAITGIILVSALIIWGTVTAVNAYINEMERLKQIQLEEEERQRLAEEEEARLQAERERQERMAKWYSCALNLAPLGLPSKRLNVPILNQYPELPAACECMALTNMLNYYGFGLDKFYLVKNHLSYSNSDWVHYYMGSPYSASNGGVCMCPAIERVYDSFMVNRPDTFRGYDVTGRNFEDLFAYVERGHPVQIWSSINMTTLGRPFATSGNYKLYSGTHSVVISGFDRASGIVYIADSINGAVSYPISRVKSIFAQQNCQAFVIISTEELDKWATGQDWSWDNTIPKVDPSQEEEENEEEE